MVSSSKHSKANKLRTTIVVVAAALFGSWSCANQASCDPGWEVEGSSCVRTTAPVDEPEARLYLGDQITVQFEPQVTDDQVERVAATHGLALLKPVAGVPRAFVFRVGPNATENPCPT